jgi:hypothetical protein
MTRFKYAIDDVISLASRTMNGSAGPFTVRQRHETDRGQVAYRIRCAGEPFDRVVEEHHIKGVVPTLQTASDAFLGIAR